MKLITSSKSWILLSTAVVIGIAFSIYFLVYVKGNEKEIVSNNFRVLQQIVQNIKQLENSYLKNAEIRSLADSNAVELNNNIKPAQDHQCNSLPDSSSVDFNKDISYGPDGIYFKVETIVNPNDQSNCLHYVTDYDVFFSNELFQRKDVFDQIIIFKTDETNGGKVTNRSVLYSNTPLGMMDSTFHKKSLRSAKDEININDKKYVSFNQVIDDEANILISGLVLKSTFDQQKRSVSPFIIFSLSIALILIILAMPLLKLKIMSLEERLHIKDVVFGVISVLVGPAVFIVFLNASFIFSSIEKDRSHANLDSLGNKVERNFQIELNRLVNQIDTLNNSFYFLKDVTTLTADSFKMDRESQAMFSSKFGEPLNFDHAQYNINGFKVYDGVIQNNLISFKHLKAAFWCTDKAEIMIFLSVFKNPGYTQELSHRKYITNIIDNEPNYFIDTLNTVHEIAIESIKSVNDGSYEIGVGKSTGWSHLPVMAISAKLASTMGTVLEEGYGFCILDKDGNTVFHSDIKKNMNENFINETHGVFKSSMNSHTGTIKTVNYNGKNQTILIRPLNCLSDHYIATFVNSEVYYSPITLSMVSAFAMFLCYLLFILAVYLILYFSNFKLSKLKQIVYVFNFIRPYETDVFYRKYNRLNVISFVIIIYLIFSIALSSHHYDFIVSELILIVVVLLVCALYSLSASLHDEKLIHDGFRKPSKKLYSVVLIVIVSLLIIRVFAFIAFSDYGISLILNAIIGLVVTAFIISEIFLEKNIFKLQYFKKKSTSHKQIQKAYFRFLMLWVIILSIIPMNLFVKITYEKENEIFAKYRSLELFDNIRTWDKTSNFEFENKFYTPKHYDRFIESMREDSINFALVETNFRINSTKPTIKYSKGEFIVKKNSVLAWSKDSTSYSEREVEIISEDSILVNGIYDADLNVIKMTFNGGIIRIRNSDSIEYNKKDIAFADDGSIIVKGKGLVSNESKKAEITSEIAKVTRFNKEVFDDLYQKIRPNLNERSVNTKSYISNVASDNLWIFSTGDNFNIFTLNPRFENTSTLTSIMIQERGFFKDHLLSIIIVIAISIFILYNFMNFILVKIYGFKFKEYADYVNEIRSKPFAGLFLEDKNFTNDSAYNNIFLVGVNSAHTSIIKKYFSNKVNKKFLSLDFYDFSEKLEKGIDELNNEHYKLNRFDRDWEIIKNYYDKTEEQIYVLVEHFEFGYNDLRLNKIKLEILKYLVDDPNFKVIVKSEINATKLLDFYGDSIKPIEILLKKSAVEKREELQNRLNDLKIDYIKWQHLLGSFVKYIIPINTIHEKNEKQEKVSLHRQNFVLEEETKHGEFLDMLNRYTNESKIVDLPYEDKILTIQQMSYPYYFSIWNSLSKEERYLVYDIAKDRFVNTVNTNAILSLLVKGILIYDHSLRLMNESFSNFVLTKVNSDEALEMEMESRKKGTWNTAFGVIILLVISIVIFLSIGQQNFLNDINAFLTAIAALIGLLIRFSGFLSFGGNKTVNT